MAATAAKTIHAAIQIEAFNDDIVLCKRAVATRRSRAVNANYRRARCGCQMQWASVAAEEKFCLASQREKLLERGIQQLDCAAARMRHGLRPL